MSNRRLSERIFKYLRTGPIMVNGSPEAMFWPDPRLLATTREPRSAVERAATLIARSCTSESDLPTFARWAAFVAMSPTQLRNAYYCVNVIPRDARDFMRILRLLTLSRGCCDSLAAGLDCRDYRTLRCLLIKAGIARSGSSHANLPSVSLDEYIACQSFLNPGHVLTRQIVATFAPHQPPTPAGIERASKNSG